MTPITLPATWLIVLIVGLPQLSETIYTPSLPEIARDLRTTDAFVEYTLTIYLFGFALGTLFWGKLSDTYGRKPCILLGLIIFILGCWGCYHSSTIEQLLMSRLIQAFGGSIGSVLGQALCRDAYHGPALTRVYASMGSALALFPAIGPVLGGIIAEHLGWANIFLVLMAFAFTLILITLVKLVETHHKDHRKSVSLGEIALRMLHDKKVLGFGLIVAGCNGILFSYFAEGSFYLIEGLGLTPSHYGFSFLLMASAAVTGGILTKRLNKTMPPKVLMVRGVWVQVLATGAFSVCAMACHLGAPLTQSVMIGVTLCSQMVVYFGIAIASSCALSLALLDYKGAIGTASSLFGFFYYCVISLFTFGMGALHDGTLIVMPLYFFGLSMMMVITNRFLIK